MIYFSILLSSAHTNLWSTLPSRAMLVLMSKHACGPELCHLLGPAGSSAAAQRAWGKALGYEIRPQVSGHLSGERMGEGQRGQGSATAGVCMCTWGGQVMLNTAVLCVQWIFMQCLCESLSRLRKGGHMAKIVSQALKTTARPHS